MQWSGRVTDPLTEARNGQCEQSVMRQLGVGESSVTLGWLKLGNIQEEVTQGSGLTMTDPDLCPV